jgi:hypothetical protein
MDFMGVIAKINLFSLFLRKFLRTLKLKMYPFSIKISYEHAAPLGHLRGGEGDMHHSDLKCHRYSGKLFLFISLKTFMNLFLN